MGTEVKSGGATPRQAIPRHGAHACRDHEIGAQKRPEDWRRSPVDGHENEPGGSKDADYASNGMRVRSRVETDQRGENYQSEQDAGNDPHERLPSRLRHFHHTGVCLGNLTDGSSGTMNRFPVVAR
jgi:hypothetical protein